MGYYFLDYLDIVVIVEEGAIAIACTNFYFSAPILETRNTTFKLLSYKEISLNSDTLDSCFWKYIPNININLRYSFQWFLNPL